MAENKELDKIEPEKVMIKVNGEEREIKFHFSAWAKLEREYKSIQNIDDVLIEKIQNEPFNTIPHLIYIGLVDKEDVNEETVLDDYSLGDLPEVSEKLLKALYGSLPADAKSKTKKARVEAKKKG